MTHNDSSLIHLLKAPQNAIKPKYSFSHAAGAGSPHGGGMRDDKEHSVATRLWCRRGGKLVLHCSLL